MASAMSRLRRVTDLFVEGECVPMGMDEDGNDVLVWVNKLNSFQVEEARRDGIAKRGVRVQELKNPDHPETVAMNTAIVEWDNDTLAKRLVEFAGDARYLQVLDDIQGDEDWTEIVEQNRRLPSLYADQGLDVDDPRMAELRTQQQAYFDEVNTRLQKAEDVAIEDALRLGREAMLEDYEKAWRDRAAIVTFMEEQRVSQLYFAIRDCQGTRGDLKESGGYEWEHKTCNHGRRLLDERSEVRELPEPFVAKVADALENLTIGQRESGNSDAPRSSSAPSEPSSSSEDQSAASIPEEIPSEEATT